MTKYTVTWINPNGEDRFSIIRDKATAIDYYMEKRRDHGKARIYEVVTTTTTTELYK